jgi:hypothetical protein
MAMLDVSALLATHLRARSGEAKMENKVITTVFSKDIDEVSTGGVNQYLEGSERANTSVKKKVLTVDDGQHVKDVLLRLMDAKADWAVDAYKTM